MARSTVLAANVGGQAHFIRVDKDWCAYHVYIDGVHFQTFRVGRGSGILPNQDLPIEIRNTPFILSVRDNRIRLVKDRRYLDTQEEFTPSRPTPLWYYLFLLLNIGIGAVLGGVLGGGGAAVASVWCARVAVGRYGPAVRFLGCLLITAGTWTAALALGSLLLSLSPTPVGL